MGSGAPFAESYESDGSRPAVVTRFDAIPQRTAESAWLFRVSVIPYYGHRYFERVPLLRQVHRTLSAIARRFNLAPLASYVYVFAVKSELGCPVPCWTAGGAEMEQ